MNDGYMKVLYDYQAFFMQRFGGISNYYVQIMRNLPSNVDYEIALHESNNIHLKDSGIMNVLPATRTADNFITEKKFRGKTFLYKLWSELLPETTSLGRNQMMACSLLSKGDYDIFHPTFYSDYFFSSIGKKPYVLTVHDMIPELFQHQFARHEEQIRNKRKLALNAAHIIAVSGKTKEDLVSLLNIPESKISVIHHGINVSTDCSDIKPLVDGKYILYVGNRGGYKNFLPMLKALIPILRVRRDIRMVCTGYPFSRKEIEYFISEKVDNQLIHLFASDIEMRNLYAHAICFIYPSLYEGFGIPILEAWRADCPVLLNKKSCFPEIAKEAAIMFTLDKQQSNLTEIMESFLKMDQQEINILIKKQRVRMTDFSWKKSAEQLAIVYDKVLNSR